jgi:PAS domain S-box-containing protein
MLASFCRTMIAQALTPMAIVRSTDTLIQCVSPAFGLLLGQEMGQVENQPLRAVLGAMGPDPVFAALTHAASTGEAVTVQVRRPNAPPADPATWTYHMCPLFDHAGRPQDLILEVQDSLAPPAGAALAAELQAVNQQLVLSSVRDQVLVEHAQVQLTLIATLTQSLSEAVCALDPAGVVTYVNPSAERMLGRSAAALLGRSAAEVIPLRGGADTVAGDVSSTFWAVMRTGVAYRDDNAQLIQADGARLPVIYTLAPMQGRGERSGAVAVLHDVSALRRLHERREEYLALIAHDLRSPLTTILGTAQLLRRRLAKQGLAREEAQALTIVDSSHRIDQMIQDVLVQSSLESGTTPTSHTTLDLGALLRQIIGHLTPESDRARIHLDTGTPILISGDPHQLERVLGNLLSNALKYSLPDQPVEVTLSLLDQQGMVAVRDHGVGIEAADLPHLFTKYYRAKTAGRFPGLGLGLYSSQLIVAAHHGRLWVESVVGSGSVFRVVFPLTQAPESA